MSVHQPQEHVHGSSVAATPFENITRIPSVPPTPTSKLPSQEVPVRAAYANFEAPIARSPRTPAHGPPRRRYISSPGNEQTLRNPQVAPLNRRGITVCY